VVVVGSVLVVVGSVDVVVGSVVVVGRVVVVVRGGFGGLGVRGFTVVVVVERGMVGAGVPALGGFCVVGGVAGRLMTGGGASVTVVSPEAFTPEKAPVVGGAVLLLVVLPGAVVGVVVGVVVVAAMALDRNVNGAKTGAISVRMPSSTEGGAVVVVPSRFPVSTLTPSFVPAGRPRPTTPAPKRRPAAPKAHRARRRVRGSLTSVGPGSGEPGGSGGAGVPLPGSGVTVATRATRGSSQLLVRDRSHHRLHSVAFTR
jgi:hypothetical protein